MLNFNFSVWPLPTCARTNRSLKMAAFEELGGDDWLFDSLNKYENLHIFELQHPTQCLEWGQHGTAVYIAGFSTEHPNEILQLSLPEKLLPPEQQSLCAKRDFRIIRGAFSKHPVTSLKYISDSDLIASSGSESCVCLWSPDTVNSDMLTMAGEVAVKGHTIGEEVFIDWTISCPMGILTGSARSLQSVQLVDMHTKKILYETGCRGPDVLLHGLHFAGQGSSTFLTCHGLRGELQLWDTRTQHPAAAVLREGLSKPSSVSTDSAGRNCHREDQGRAVSSKTKQPGSSLQSKDDDSVVVKETSDHVHRNGKGHSAHGAGGQPSTDSRTAEYVVGVSDEELPAAKFAVVCSSGSLALYDSRNLVQPYASCRGLGSTSMEVFRSRFSRFSVAASQQVTCVQFSPASCHMISLSGMGKGVSVYDTASWSTDVEAPTPLFFHPGHEQDCPIARVTVHSWHPSLPHTLLSADSEGNLHSWQWK